VLCDVKVSSDIPFIEYEKLFDAQNDLLIKIIIIIILQVQKNDRLKSVFGPGLHRDHKTEDVIKDNIYQQGPVKDGVMIFHKICVFVYDRNIDHFKFLFFKLICFRRITRK